MMTVEKLQAKVYPAEGLKHGTDMMWDVEEGGALSIMLFNTVPNGAVEATELGMKSHVQMIW